jgi:hypothetical protein
MFVTAHQSVEATSLRMFAALKRRYHVTPTNYLETVANYRAVLTEKRTELSSKANKLKGGLTKLDETRVQVKLARWCCPVHTVRPQLKWLLAQRSGSLAPGAVTACWLHTKPACCAARFVLL